MTSNKKRVRLSDIIGPAFYETHKLIDMGVIDEAVESGGRASLKSSYVGTELVLQLLKHPDCHALVTRQVGDTMRDSVYAQILWAIDKLGLTTKFKCTQSPLQCTYLPTGQRILFRGLDDPQKIKSIKLPFGYIGILWFEEADQIKGGEDAVRNVQQSALRGGEFGLTFISFNPPAASRNWANRYAREERKGKRIHHSTYLQAPAAWLGPKFLAQAEYIKETQPTKYRHEYLGEVVGSGTQVFENLRLEPISQKTIRNFDTIENGVDWGWYPDPWAFNRCHYDAARKTLYIFDELTRLRTSNEETAKLVQQRIESWESVTADSAEMKSCADCIDELIKDISRRVQKAGAITDTAEYQLYRAQALGESKKAIEQAVSKQIGISEEVIASLFEYVADKSLGLDENGSLKRMTEAYTRMTQSKTRELLRDLWADTPEGKVQPLQTAYARAMDFAFRQVATGTLDLDTAIRRAVTPLAKRGLRTIEQKSGRSVGIEYACRRYIMDQLGQLDDEIQRADHDALGCDGWEISAHAACAPDHEPIQGRQYGDAEFEKLNNSLQRRIGHLNCGHTANPIILGVNAPQYTEAQLQKFKDDNGRGVVYNGYRYTLYEAGQEQSRIENGIRLIKRQILADEETESPDLQKHQIKLRVVQAEYARFCKAVGLPTRSERLQVAGFGRSQSNRAVWAYKKAAPEQLRDIEIAGHKLYSVTDERIRAVPKPFFQGVSNKVNGLAQEYARGVLKKVQGLEVGTEAVVNFTKDGKCTGYYVGGQNSMKVKPPEIQVPYYSLHNHPSNGILSPEDIQQLIKRPQMQGIGAVGNAGALFTCEKVFGYSQKNAEGWFKALKKKYPLYKGESGKIEDALAQRIAFAEELRRDGAKYGLIFSR